MATNKKEISSPPLKKVDALKLFKVKPAELETFNPEEHFDYDKLLPKGEEFVVSFEPVENWKKGLRGFNIKGLKRSKVIGFIGQVVSRLELIKTIITVLSPGDVNLEDVKIYHADQNGESKLNKAKKAVKKAAPKQETQETE